MRRGGPRPGGVEVAPDFGFEGASAGGKDPNDLPGTAAKMKGRPSAQSL